LTGFTYAASTRLLTVSGTGFMTNHERYQKVMFAQSTCTIDTDSMKGAGFECTLDRTPTCGTYTPTVTTIYGNVKHSSAVTPTTVECTITGVFPDTELNLLGNDNITFSGTNLPHDISELNHFDIHFNDEQNTKCAI
jgi:uncharacterized protein YfaP (DUF2135 family)